MQDFTVNPPQKYTILLMHRACPVKTRIFQECQACTGLMVRTNCCQLAHCWQKFLALAFWWSCETTCNNQTSRTFCLAWSVMLGSYYDLMPTVTSLISSNPVYLPELKMTIEFVILLLLKGIRFLCAEHLAINFNIPTSSENLWSCCIFISSFIVRRNINKQTNKETTARLIPITEAHSIK